MIFEVVVVVVVSNLVFDAARKIGTHVQRRGHVKICSSREKKATRLVLVKEMDLCHARARERNGFIFRQKGGDAVESCSIYFFLWSDESREP
jgi:hypothetical protein